MDTSGDQMLDLDEFKKMLITLDSQLKSLPATAQVASQQGKYIGMYKDTIELLYTMLLVLYCSIMYA